MELKTFEIRDAATFIPVVAVRAASLTEGDVYLLRRAGYISLSYQRWIADTRADETSIVLVYLSTGKVRNDPDLWSSRTMKVAHEHIQAMWDTLKSGCVIDVEYLLGLTETEKISERFSF